MPLSAAAIAFNAVAVKTGSESLWLPLLAQAATLQSIATTVLLTLLALGAVVRFFINQGIPGHR